MTRHAFTRCIALVAATPLLILSGCFNGGGYNGSVATGVELGIPSDSASTSGNPFVAADGAVASLGLSVSLRSHATVRHALLTEARLPAPDEVAVEGLLNAVIEADEGPPDGISVAIEAAPAPFGGATIARVVVRAADGADVVAEDAQLTVRFHPRYVAAYRLFGHTDTTGELSGEVVGGQSMVTVWELVAADDSAPAPVVESTNTVTADTAQPLSDAALMEVSVRYRPVGAERSEVVVATLRPDAVAPSMDDASAALQFSLTVAAFAEILAESPYRWRYGLAAIEARMAQTVNGDPRRADMLAMVRAAIDLMPVVEQPWQPAGS